MNFVIFKASIMHIFGTNYIFFCMYSTCIYYPTRVIKRLGILLTCPTVGFTFDDTWRQSGREWYVQKVDLPESVWSGLSS